MQNERKYSKETMDVIKQVGQDQIDFIGGEEFIAELVNTMGKDKTLKMIGKSFSFRKSAYQKGDEECYSDEVVSLLKHMDEKDVKRLGGKDEIEEIVKTYGYDYAKKYFERCGYLKENYDIDDIEDEL
jgi:hypothetical protein